MSIFDDLELDEHPNPPTVEPEVTPPSGRDAAAVLARGETFDLLLPLADPCPVCGAFRMCVGDYVYLGCCTPCFEYQTYGDRT